MKKSVSRIFCLVILLMVFSIQHSNSDAVPIAFIYVDVSNNSGIEDGTLAHPYNTIMEGITAAVSGIIVQVAAGTYYENVIMKEGVDLIGAGANASRIYGNGMGDVVVGAEDCEISGFYIYNSGPDQTHDGIECISCSMLIRNNIIAYCTNGIYCFNSSSTITNNVISFCGNEGNSYMDYGILCNASNLTITNNVIHNHKETGIYACWAGSNSAVIINNTIVDNGWYGVWCYQSSPTIKNNIIMGHTTAGISATFSSSPQISYNNVWNNNKNYDSYSSSTCAPGTGAMSADPLFVYPGCGNYRVCDNSPCIGAGTTGPDVPSSDNEGNPRPNPTGSRPDMGAYENQTGIGQLPHFHSHDFNGNAISDVSVWRPSNGMWYIKDVGGSVWGQLADIPASGDYNGDGTTDIAVWRPSNGRWYIQGVPGTAWGLSGDIPVPGDYDGNGTADIAVWRPSNGRWYIKGIPGSVWGQLGDIPVPGDYDGNGTTDIAVWRPSNGRWYIKGIPGSVWGQLGDIPVPGDYDGDGTADIAVWRPSSGRWYIKGAGSAVWGALGDIPVPGDYDGNNKTDIAVYRPSIGKWFLKDLAGHIWGMAGDIPLVR